MKLKLVDKKHQAPDAVSFVFHPGERVQWQAGQYAVLKLPHSDPDDRGEERYFSISSAPHEEDIMITTRLVERPSTFKRALSSLPLGATLEAAGPEGDFVVSDPTEEVVFIAIGAGITPYRSILLDLDRRGISITLNLLYANRDEHLIYRDELEALARRHPGFRLHYFLGERRIDETTLRELVADPKKPLFYVSGPDPAVEHLEKVLLPSLGVPQHHMKTDYFSGSE